MSPAGRQVDCFLLLFILLLIPTVTATFLLTQADFSDNRDLVENTLSDLVSGPLRGLDLLLVTDNHSEDLLDVGRVVATAGTSTTPVLLTTQHSLLHTPRPAHHTRGTQLTALLLFHSDPTPFLLLLADNKHWNPNYLVLFCLDPHLNTTVVLSLPVVQRSQFILLLQSAARGGLLRLNAYTSRPFQHGNQNNQLIKAPLGVWNSLTFHSLPLAFPPRFNNFEGKVLKVSMVCLDEPFLYVAKDKRCVGVHADAMEVIGQKLNFNFELIHRETFFWGVKINGTWQGLIGDLVDGSSDFTINTLIITPDRVSDFDWTYPHWEHAFAFLSRVPPPMPRWKNVMYPFPTQVWLYILLATFGSTSALTFILYSFHYITDPVAFILKMSAGLVNQYMPDREVVVWWARVWLVVWWLAADILVAAYTSNLVAVLTVPVFPYRIQTVEELAESDIIPIIADYGSMVPDAMRSSINPSMAALGRRLYLAPLTDIFDETYVEPLKKVLSGSHVLIENANFLNYFQNWKNVVDETYILKEQLYKSYLSWWMPLHTPYSPVISHYFTRLLETGLLEKMFETNVESYMAKPTISTEETGGGQVLTLAHLQAAFILLLIGLFMASLCLVVEQLTFN